MTVDRDESDRRGGGGKEEEPGGKLEGFSPDEDAFKSMTPTLKQARVKDLRGVPPLPARVTGTRLLSEVACQYDAFSPVNVRRKSSRQPFWRYMYMCICF